MVIKNNKPQFFQFFGDSLSLKFLNFKVCSSNWAVKILQIPNFIKSSSQVINKISKIGQKQKKINLGQNCSGTKQNFKNWTQKKINLGQNCSGSK
jgi:hypothetical protein